MTLVTKAHISFLLFCKQSVQLILAGRRFILLPVENDAKILQVPSKKNPYIHRMPVLSSQFTIVQHQGWQDMLSTIFSDVIIGQSHKKQAL